VGEIMSVWWLAFILAALFAVGAGFIWVVFELRKNQSGKRTVKDLNRAYSDIAEEDVDHLFNKEFREELRNRGRLRFEKIIDENAMFLKQDLDLTISQLNQYMKQQVAAKLDTEFAAYAKAMQEAQELALNSLKQTATDVETQRLALANALKKDVAEREAVLLKVYEGNMAKIVEHYVLLSLGDQFDLKAQLPYIINQMEENKENIIEDMRL
jgi:hypothetical protein